MSLPSFTLVSLVAACAGTLVYLFLIVLIVGYRRRRQFERVLFFLCLALFLVYSGILLGINVSIYYPEMPEATGILVAILVVSGIAVLPGLLVHANISYGRSFGAWQQKKWPSFCIVAGYLPSVALLLQILLILRAQRSDDFGFILHLTVDSFFFWATVSAIIGLGCAALQVAFARAVQPRSAVGAEKPPSKAVHYFMAACFAAIGIVAAEIFISSAGGSVYADNFDLLSLLVLGVLPGAGLIYADRAIQFSWDWCAEESCLCNFGCVSGAAVFGCGAAGECLAGARASA